MVTNQHERGEHARWRSMPGLPRRNRRLRRRATRLRSSIGSFRGCVAPSGAIGGRRRHVAPRARQGRVGPAVCGCRTRFRGAVAARRPSIREIIPENGGVRKLRWALFCNGRAWRPRPCDLQERAGCNEKVGAGPQPRGIRTGYRGFEMATKKTAGAAKQMVRATEAPEASSRD